MAGEFALEDQSGQLAGIIGRLIAAGFKSVEALNTALMMVVLARSRLTGEEQPDPARIYATMSEALGDLGAAEGVLPRRPTPALAEKLSRIYAELSDLSAAGILEYLYLTRRLTGTGMSIPESLLLTVEGFFEEPRLSVLIVSPDRFFGAELLRAIEAFAAYRFTLCCPSPIEYELLTRAFAHCPQVEILMSEELPAGRKFDFILATAADAAERRGPRGRRSAGPDEEGIFTHLQHLSAEGVLFYYQEARLLYGRKREAELRRLIVKDFGVVGIVLIPGALISPAAANPPECCLIQCSARPKATVALSRLRSPAAGVSLINPEIAIAGQVQYPLAEFLRLPNWYPGCLLLRSEPEITAFLAAPIPRVALGEVAEIFRGKAVEGTGPAGPVALISIGDLREETIDFAHLGFVSGDRRRLSPYVLAAGDLLITARGSTFRAVCYVPRPDLTCVASGNLLVIRPGPRLNPGYLRLFLLSGAGQLMLGDLSHSAGSLNLSGDDLGELLIPLPSRIRQDNLVRRREEEQAAYEGRMQELKHGWAVFCQQFDAALLGAG